VSNVIKIEEVEIDFTEEERAALDALAKDAGLTVSAYLRKMIRDEEAAMKRRSRR
jgi:hypothetical protein